jgi:hypothetical protein
MHTAMAAAGDPERQLLSLFRKRQEKTAIYFCDRFRCWMRPKSNACKRIRFSGLTKHIAPTFFGRCDSARLDRTGLVGGVSSAHRGSAFDRSLQVRASSSTLRPPC